MVDMAYAAMTDDTVTEDPQEIIKETLLWVLGERDNHAVTDYLPED